MDLKKSYADECLERIKNAKLTSDDFDHDVIELREYCEGELIYAYREMVPELAMRLNKSCNELRRAAYHIDNEDVARNFMQIADQLESPLKKL